MVTPRRLGKLRSSRSFWRGAFSLVVCSNSTSIVEAAGFAPAPGSTCAVSPALPAPSTLTGVAPVPPVRRVVASSPLSSVTNGNSAADPAYRDEVSLVHDLDEGLAGNSTAASALVRELSNLRNSGRREEADGLLDALLSVVDDDDAARAKPSALPWWIRIRPLARFSRRARRASLRRVLRLSTPSLDEDSGNDEDENAEEARLKLRRRSLGILLRTLATPLESDTSITPQNANLVSRLKRWMAQPPPRIVSIERLARHDAKAGATAEDMDRRLPPGLETPSYAVLARREKGYEIRRYDAYAVCTVDMDAARPSDKAQTDAKISNPQLAGASSFGALAGYLFGKNDQSLSMKMTTPVLTTGQDDGRRKMSFVMPSQYWQEEGLDSAPKPLDESGVVLERNSGGDSAVLMFGGFAGRREVEKMKKELLDYLKDDAEWEPAQRGIPVALAQYNDPFTPPWKRRNEVSIPVVPRFSAQPT